jgi:hypothetical protein
VRVVLSDAVKQWAASLLQARPVLRTEVIFDVSDRLLNPRAKPPPLEAHPAQPAKTPQADAASAPPAITPAPAPATAEPARRARVIFHAAAETKPFDPADLDFEFDERVSNEVPEDLVESSRAEQLPAAAPRTGLSRRQLLVLAIMVLVEIAVLAAFLYLILFGSA